MTAGEGAGRHWTVQAASIRPALLHGGAVAIASLVSYLLVTHALAAVHSVSQVDDTLGGMWAVIATVFVYRFGYYESVTAAASRAVATVLSFVLTLAYLLVLPFNPLGLAVLIGLGTAVLKLLGREADIVTTTITTAVVMVVAALSPTAAWQQPILRLIDTGVGIAIGLVAIWLARASEASQCARPRIEPPRTSRSA